MNDLESLARSLTERNSQLTTLLDHLSDGILVEDANGRVLLANPSFFRMFQIPANINLSGMECRVAAQAAASLFLDRQGFLARIEHILGAGVTVRGEVIPLADGRIFERDYVPISLEAVSAGRMWVYRDITETRRAAEQLQTAKMQAEAASQAKTSFLAAMSHDIRTPINTILGLAELLGAVQLNPEAARFVEDINRNAEVLLHLVSDILDVSRIESGQLELQWVPVDLSALVEEIAQMFRARATSKGVQLNFEVDPEFPASLLGDPLRLRQVLLNLVANAVKFTTKGFIRVELQGNLRGNLVDCRLVVADTGPGITPQEQARIFDRFYQGAQAQGRGAGLGLFITQSIVAKMGGRIGLVSNDVGSRFDIEFALPLFEAQDPELLPEDYPAIDVMCPDNERTNLTLCLQKKGAYLRKAAVGQPQLLIVSDRFVGGLERVKNHLGPVIWVTDDGPGRPSLPGHVTLLRRPYGRQALAAALREAVPMWTAQAPQNNPLRVMVVEDDLDGQQVISLLLSRAGHKVQLATTGRAALEVKDSFDVILMDVDLPDMSGLEVAQQMRWLGDETPIVGLTAHATADMRQRCWDAGMSAYLPKPVRPRDLVSAVERFARRHRQRTMDIQPDEGTPIPVGWEVYSSPPPEVIDPDILDLLPNYLAQRRIELGRLEQYLAEQKWSDLERVGHQLKGSAPLFGYVGLGTRGSHLEAAAKIRHKERCEGAIRALLQELEEVEKRYQRLA